MKNFQLIKSGLISSTILGALFAPLSAFAIPYQGATVYKAMEGSSQVVVFSGTPGSRVSASLGSSDKSTARLAGSCGEVRISPPASGDLTGLKVDEALIDVASLPTQTLPSCVSGSFAEARSANFKTATNQIIIVGKTPGAAVNVSLPTATIRAIAINACGFGVLKASSGQTLPSTISVGITNYTIASLPDSVSTPFCRTVSGTPYGYIPKSWMP